MIDRFDDVSWSEDKYFALLIFGCLFCIAFVSIAGFWLLSFLI